MNVLAQIVPAVREVRAPLVGGFLWLLAAWLFVAERVPAAADVPPGSLWAHLRRGADLLGPGGGLIALSVGAYLVGSLVGELVDWVVRRHWLDAERLADLGEAVPKTKPLVETALRFHAEAQLRLHVALPLVVVAGAVALRGYPAAIAVVAAAIAMAVHGRALARRAWRKGETARSLADSARDELTTEERQLRSAQIDVTTTQHRGARGVDYYVLFQNSGNAPARDVDLVPAGDADSFDFLIAGTLPIEELMPGESVEVPIALSFGSPQTAAVRVRWLDPTGERSYERSLRLM